MRQLVSYIITLALAFSLHLSNVQAYEMSGEIIKELMESVDKEMSILEEKTLDFDREKAILLDELEAKAVEFKNERDIIRKENMKVDVLIINAKLNQKDIEEVEAYLGTIAKIVPKLEQLKIELNSGGHYELKEDFEVYRQKIGNFMTKAASILSILKETAPKSSQRDIEILENNLVGILTSWDSPLSNVETSVEQVDKTVKDLEDAYAQLIIVKNLLDQERTKLKVINYTAIANLALIRLGRGKLSGEAFLQTPVNIRKGVSKRSEITDMVLAEQTAFSLTISNSSTYRDAKDLDSLTRIRTANYGWE
ncbi:MAG: hypothetical protein AMJ42_00910 [Deltaproteobacteria bacterium DG_8]|nr:MAG: hypothetical protein AMJ42_00910 [Deltaproteobacteria bacterium DG_8]